MSEPFLGEMRWVSFSLVPKGWAACNGQLMPISQNQTLYSLIGTTYGGDGTTTFALPNMSDRTPIHIGENLLPGSAGGATEAVVSIAEMPAHLHVPKGTTIPADSPLPTPSFVLAGALLYGPPSNLVAMSPANVTNTGGSQPHTNIQPYLNLQCIMAIEGVFPSRN